METTVVAVAATTAPQATGTRQGQTMPMGHRARFRALAGVCIFLTLLALAACGSATSGRPVSPGFAGYDWQVIAIGHGGKVTPIPARLEVALQFSPGGQFDAFDSVSGHSGTYRATGDGFTTGVLDVNSPPGAGTRLRVELPLLCVLAGATWTDVPGVI